jgi:4-diphosphocytidyl-2-C-methyl-D-erythritol kinase
MTKMLIETAHAKINLALHVRVRRADGYHELETLFAFAEDGDRLSGELADELSLTLSGPHAAGLAGEGNNLVLRAARALQVATKTRRGAALHLDKRLPVAAGLGGGSADAGATLRLLAQLWNIDPCDPSIIAVAGTLGADVPACVTSATCFGKGRGDELAMLGDPSLSGTPILLVNPGIALSTAAVFAGWDGLDRGALDPADWRCGRNDLTSAAIALVPDIAGLLGMLESQAGAHFVRMSGSGATCFALFDSIAACDAAARKIPFWHMSTVLR